MFKTEISIFASSMFISFHSGRCPTVDFSSFFVFHHVTSVVSNSWIVLNSREWYTKLEKLSTKIKLHSDLNELIRN